MRFHPALLKINLPYHFSQDATADIWLMRFLLKPCAILNLHIRVVMVTKSISDSPPTGSLQMMKNLWSEMRLHENNRRTIIAGPGAVAFPPLLAFIDLEKTKERCKPKHLKVNISSLGVRLLNQRRSMMPGTGLSWTAQVKASRSFREHSEYQLFFSTVSSTTRKSRLSSLGSQIPDGCAAFELLAGTTCV